MTIRLGGAGGLVVGFGATRIAAVELEVAITRRRMMKLAGLAVVAGPGVLRRVMGSTPASTQESAMPTVSVKVFNDKGELVGPIAVARVVKSDAEWQSQLTAAQYKIARAKGTEAPFCGNLLDNHKAGVYSCVCCGLPLFSSDSKFNSGTGWPSFFQPIGKENVIEHVDDSYNMHRTEILCARCDCHLGHVFEDGPRPTGLRFCVNSESLKFTDGDKLADLADPAAKKAATTQVVK